MDNQNLLDNYSALTNFKNRAGLNINSTNGACSDFIKQKQIRFHIKQYLTENVEMLQKILKTNRFQFIEKDQKSPCTIDDIMHHDKVVNLNPKHYQNDIISFIENLFL
jgi:hypothetical protein